MKRRCPSVSSTLRPLGFKSRVPPLLLPSLELHDPLSATGAAGTPSHVPSSPPPRRPASPVSLLDHNHARCKPLAPFSLTVNTEWLLDPHHGGAVTALWHTTPPRFHGLPTQWGCSLRPVCNPLLFMSFFNFQNQLFV
jgi:hypothetical protein